MIRVSSHGGVLVTVQQASLLASLKQVTEFDFLLVKFDDAGIRALSQATQVESLRFENVPLTDDDLLILSENQSVRLLQLTRTQVTPAGLAKFRAARPDVKVESDVE